MLQATGALVNPLHGSLVSTQLSRRAAMFTYKAETVKPLHPKRLKFLRPERHPEMAYLLGLSAITNVHDIFCLTCLFRPILTA
jgi:hypothetical protein